MPAKNRRRHYMLACLLLSSGPLLADIYPREDIVKQPGPALFSVCHGHTCRHLAVVSLLAAEWNIIIDIMRLSTSAATERYHLAQALAYLEQRVGERTGTGNDLGGTFPGLGKQGQMDCIDESVNTSLYLKMLAQADLLRWHAPANRAARGWFLFGWPHSTAVIRELATARHFAVDSWFHDNGHAPEIVPLTQWKSGWRPS